LCAGARSTVVSLWPVGDREASRFMEAFYRRLSSGETKEEALRRAKLELLDSEDPSPRRWAGFVLIGEGDRPVPLRPPSVRQMPMSRLR
jgi:CHAT domain-containing protein